MDLGIRRALVEDTATEDEPVYSMWVPVLRVAPSSCAPPLHDPPSAVPITRTAPSPPVVQPRDSPGELPQFGRLSPPSQHIHRLTYSVQDQVSKSHRSVIAHSSFHQYSEDRETAESLLRLGAGTIYDVEQSSYIIRSCERYASPPLTESSAHSGCASLKESASSSQSPAEPLSPQSGSSPQSSSQLLSPSHEKSLHLLTPRAVTAVEVVVPPPEPAGSDDHLELHAVDIREEANPAWTKTDQEKDYRRSACVRERTRMRDMNRAFDKLRQRIPPMNKPSKKLSKIESLRMAIRYIRDLQSLLDAPSTWPPSPHCPWYSTPNVITENGGSILPHDGMHHAHLVDQTVLHASHPGSYAYHPAVTYMYDY